MAVSSLGFACRSHFPVRPLFYCLSKVRLNTLAVAIGTFDDKDSDHHDKDSDQTRHGVYLVGGCVRDLILKQTPKDFDIFTSAELREDCARILRGTRIAARLGFTISKQTAHFLQSISFLLQRLHRGRILMEMNYTLAYGSAEASLRFLWKFGILEIVLPFQRNWILKPYFDVAIKEALGKMTDARFISKAMAAYHQAPYSYMVFIPFQMYLDVRRIFECVKESAWNGFVPKQDSKIDYTVLSSGGLGEIRHVFARVVFDTVFPFNPSQDL